MEACRAAELVGSAGAALSQAPRLSASAEFFSDAQGSERVQPRCSDCVVSAYKMTAGIDPTSLHLIQLPARL